MTLTSDNLKDPDMNRSQITKSRKIVEITDQGSDLVINKVKVKPGDLVICPNLQANKMIRCGWAVEFIASPAQFRAIQAEVEKVLRETSEFESKIIVPEVVPQQMEIKDDENSDEPDSEPQTTDENPDPSSDETPVDDKAEEVVPEEKPEVTKTSPKKTKRKVKK